MGELEGSLLHRELMTKSAECLQKQGYTTFFSATLYPSRYRTDVLGLKDTEIVGIECQTGLDKHNIEYKVKNNLPHLTKMIFAIPLLWNGIVPESNKFEVIKIDTENKIKNNIWVGQPKQGNAKLTLSVKAETREYLKQTYRHRIGQFFDNMVQVVSNKKSGCGDTMILTLAENNKPYCLKCFIQHIKEQKP